MNPIAIIIGALMLFALPAHSQPDQGFIGEDLARVCERSPKVKKYLEAKLSLSCDRIIPLDLAKISSLNIGFDGESLQDGDLVGLTGLRKAYLQEIASIPQKELAQLTSLNFLVVEGGAVRTFKRGTLEFPKSLTVLSLVGVDELGSRAFENLMLESLYLNLYPNSTGEDQFITKLPPDTFDGFDVTQLKQLGIQVDDQSPDVSATLYCTLDPIQLLINFVSERFQAYLRCPPPPF